MHKKYRIHLIAAAMGRKREEYPRIDRNALLQADQNSSLLDRATEIKLFIEKIIWVNQRNKDNTISKSVWKEFAAEVGQIVSILVNATPR